jgi:hypothetical protein
VWHFQVNNELDQWLTFEKDIDIYVKKSGARELVLSAASALALLASQLI